jgi:hypothetical protein
LAGLIQHLPWRHLYQTWQTIAAVTKQNYDRRQLSQCTMFNGGFAAGIPQSRTVINGPGGARGVGGDRQR